MGMGDENRLKSSKVCSCDSFALAMCLANENYSLDLLVGRGVWMQKRNLTTFLQVNEHFLGQKAFDAEGKPDNISPGQ